MDKLLDAMNLAYNTTLKARARYELAQKGPNVSLPAPCDAVRLWHSIAATWLLQSNTRFWINIHASDYPRGLLELKDPPLILFGDGQRLLLNARGVAMVGSRNATRTGLGNAQAFGKAFAQAGWAVISGLAEGIDGAAHDGALAARGATIAVLGCGPDEVYPKHHAGLKSQIVQQGGLVLSEYPPGTAPQPAFFPRRNRIIAALADAATAADALGVELDDAGRAASGAGVAGKAAGDAAADGAKQAATGWAAVTAALADYAAKARDIGGDIGQALVGAFQSAENAFRTFVTTGKVDFKSLVSAILADLATLAFKNAVLGPIANWLSQGLGGIFAPVQHAGGMVGSPGPGRMVPALAFAGAQRMHSGGWAGLRPDEVPAILQRGERVLSRAEVASGLGRRPGAGAGGVSISIDARGAQAGVAEQIDARLRAAIPEIARLAKASVADGRRRGQSL